MKILVGSCLLVVFLVFGFFGGSYFWKKNYTGSDSRGGGGAIVPVDVGTSDLKADVIWINSKGEYVFNLQFEEFDSQRRIISKADGTTLGVSLLAAKVSIAMGDKAVRRQILVPLLVRLENGWLITYSEGVNDKQYSDLELERTVETVKNELATNMGWSKGRVLLVNLTKNLSEYYEIKSYVDTRAA